MDHQQRLSLLHTQTLDGMVHDHAQRIGDRVAIVDGSVSLTYSELEDVIARLAGVLAERGLGEGDHLIAFPRRTWELPVFFLACARVGAVFLPLEDRTDFSRVDAVLGPKVKLAWLPLGNEALAQHLTARLGGLESVIRSGPGKVGENHLERLLLEEGQSIGPSSDPQSVCYMNFTSGSTGLPKGAPTTHANIQWNSRAVLEVFPFREDERFLCLFAPFAHPHEHWARPLAVGACVVMVDKLRPRSVLQAIEEHQVSWLFAIPSVFELLLTAVDGLAAPGCLRMGESGGAVVSADLVRRAEQKLGCDFLPIWGCTESTGVVLHVPPWEEERSIDMLGKVVAHYDAKVGDVDEATGIGELCVRGPAVVSGYDGREDETREKFQDGWYATGDLVRAEEGGYFRFLGRKEEMIKVGGIKVYLLEIERHLAELNGIERAIVVPALDALRGEVPRAVIVREKGVELNRNDVISHCRNRLPAPMIPRIVEFWDELPTSPSGKINKRAITERQSHQVAMAINSMVIANRPLLELVRIALRCEKRHSFPVFLDLRSRRDPASDPEGIWEVAHDNSDFDIGDRESVEAATKLAADNGLQIAAASAYLGACNPSDLEYGLRVIDNAYALAVAAPNSTLVLRILGGDLRARARQMEGRWLDIRRELRDESLATIKIWEAHSRKRAAETGRKVFLGLEIHHGQYLSNLHDIHHCCRGMRDVGWEYFGFIEDPANRFISSEGDRMGALDFARIIQAWGGRILAYHIKDVRYVSPWSQFFPQPLQRVGEKVFVWGVHKFEWVDLGEGEVDLEQSLMAAQTHSKPAHPWCLVSTECVSASRDEAHAEEIIERYARLLIDGAANH